MRLQEVLIARQHCQKEATPSEAEGPNPDDPPQGIEQREQKQVRQGDSEPLVEIITRNVIADKKEQKFSENVGYKHFQVQSYGASVKVHTQNQEEEAGQ